MHKFTGKSINLSIQEAFQDAVRQALIHTAEDEHHLLTTVEVTRIFSTRAERTGFRTVFVEIEAQ